MAHFLKKLFASGPDAMVGRLAPSLNKQSPNLLKNAGGRRFHAVFSVADSWGSAVDGKGLNTPKLTKQQRRW